MTNYTVKQYGVSVELPVDALDTERIDMETRLLETVVKRIKLETDRRVLALLSSTGYAKYQYDDPGYKYRYSDEFVHRDSSWYPYCVMPSLYY